MEGNQKFFFFDAKRKTAGYLFSFVLIFHPVDSTDLTQCKTNDRNGITLKMALVGGRYNEQVSRPQALESRIA